MACPTFKLIVVSYKHLKGLFNSFKNPMFNETNKTLLTVL